MSWKCPWCKVEHNKIAEWTMHNGQKVTGFCSDSCVSAYRAAYPDYSQMASDAAYEKKVKGKGLAGRLLSGLGRAAMKDVRTLFGG